MYYLFISCIISGLLSVPIGLMRYKYEVKMVEAGLLQKSLCYFKFEDYKPHWDQIPHSTGFFLLFFFYPITLTIILIFKLIDWFFGKVGNLGDKIADSKIKEHRIKIEMEENYEEAKIEIDNSKYKT